MEYISSDDEFLEFLDLLVPEQRRRVKQRPNHVEELKDEEFLARYRVNKNTVAFIAAEIADEISPKTTR